MTTINELKTIADGIKDKGYDFDFEFVGLRVQEDAYGAKIGDVLEHNSLVWEDGEETDEALNGVCAVSVKALGTMSGSNGYFGRTVLVLGSKAAEYGEDAGEIVMQDAVVLDIIEL